MFIRHFPLIFDSKGRNRPFTNPCLKMIGRQGGEAIRNKPHVCGNMKAHASLWNLAMCPIGEVPFIISLLVNSLRTTHYACQAT